MGKMKILIPKFHVNHPFANGNTDTFVDIPIDENTPIMDFLIATCARYKLGPATNYSVLAPIGHHGTLESCKPCWKLGMLKTRGSSPSTQSPLVEFVQIVEKNKYTHNKSIQDFNPNNNANHVRHAKINGHYSMSNKLTICQQEKSYIDSLKCNSFTKERSSNPAIIIDENIEKTQNKNNQMENGGGRKVNKINSFSSMSSKVAQSNGGTYRKISEFNTSYSSIPFEVTQRVLISILPLSLGKKYVVRASLDEPLHCIRKRVCQESQICKPHQCCFVSTVNFNMSSDDDKYSSIENNVSSPVLDLDKSMRDYNLCTELYLLLRSDSQNKSVDDTPNPLVHKNSIINSNGPNQMHDKDFFGNETKTSPHNPEESITNQPVLNKGENLNFPSNTYKNSSKSKISTADNISLETNCTKTKIKRAPLPPLPSSNINNDKDSPAIEAHFDSSPTDQKYVGKSTGNINKTSSNECKKPKSFEDDSSFSSGYLGSSSLSPSPCYTELGVNKATESKCNEKKIKKASAPKPPKRVPLEGKIAQILSHNVTDPEGEEQFDKENDIGELCEGIKDTSLSINEHENIYECLDDDRECSDNMRCDTVHSVISDSPFSPYTTDLSVSPAPACLYHANQSEDHKDDDGFRLIKSPCGGKEHDAIYTEPFKEFHTTKDNVPSSPCKDANTKIMCENSHRNAEFSKKNSDAKNSELTTSLSPKTKLSMNIFALKSNEIPIDIKNISESDKHKNKLPPNSRVQHTDLFNKNDNKNHTNIHHNKVYKFRTSDCSDIILKCKSDIPKHESKPSTIKSRKSEEDPSADTKPSILDKEKERPWTLTTLFRSSNHKFSNVNNNNMEKNVSCPDPTQSIKNEKCKFLGTKSKSNAKNASLSKTIPNVKMVEECVSDKIETTIKLKDFSKNLPAKISECKSLPTHENPCKCNTTNNVLAESNIETDGNAAQSNLVITSPVKQNICVHITSDKTCSNNPENTNEKCLENITSDNNVNFGNTFDDLTLDESDRTKHSHIHIETIKTTSNKNLINCNNNSTPITHIKHATIVNTSIKSAQLPYESPSFQSSMASKLQNIYAHCSPGFDSRSGTSSDNDDITFDKDINHKPHTSSTVNTFRELDRNIVAIDKNKSLEVIEKPQGSQFIEKCKMLEKLLNCNSNKIDNPSSHCITPPADNKITPTKSPPIAPKLNSFYNLKENMSGGSNIPMNINGIHCQKSNDLCKNDVNCQPRIQNHNSAKALSFNRDTLMKQIRSCGGKNMLKRTSTLKREKCTIFQSAAEQMFHQALGKV